MGSGVRPLEWLRDGALRKVVRYGVPIAIGKLAASAAGLVTLALLARHLGAALFGVLAVIRTVVLVVETYAGFNTWQAIIKYGTEAIAAGRRDDVKRVIKLGVAIDLATAAVGAAVIAGLAFVVPAMFEWSARESVLCAAYAVTIVTRVAGASDGIFRICDAYRTQAIATTLGAVAVAASAVVAVALDASFTGCVAALIAGEVVSNAIVTATAFWVAAQHGYGGWARTPFGDLRAAFPGIVRFMLATNGQVTVKRTQGELDMVVVGALLGKAPAGLFRAVKQLGALPGHVFMPFEQVLFTELAHAAAARDHAGFARLLRRAAGLAALGSLLVWAAAAALAAPILELVAGAEFAAAAPAFRWYLLAMALQVTSAPIQRAMIALGRPGTLFLFDLATLGVLVAAVIAGAHLGGLAGVAAAVALHRAIQLAWSAWLVARTLRAELRQQRGGDVGDVVRIADAREGAGVGDEAGVGALVHRGDQRE